MRKLVCAVLNRSHAEGDERRFGLMAYFAGVFSSGCFVLCSIGFIKIGYLRYERIVRIGVCEHRANRKQNCIIQKTMNIHFSRQLVPSRG
jgi:hypothetical protein